MWLFTMFDLPVKTPAQKKHHARFRKALLGEGFTMLQYSVYARFCQSEEASEAFSGNLRGLLPPEGRVRMLAVTDRQFGKMRSFIGQKNATIEAVPEQFLLF